jgi:hypothetical protein
VILRLLIALLIGYSVWRLGMWAVRTIGSPPPPPPPPGEMRRIKLVYRCDICGTEVRMTKAATESPEPPRHCMEEMEYVPIDD